MNDSRPDPDALLARVAADAARQARGKLKIFFGASPGVGKTYAMLEAARKIAKEGVDVVVGYVEPHARSETQALVLGLDVLPRREVEYRGKRLHEFDLSAALARKPRVLLVDELAHTNVTLPGGQMVVHTKRWRDVVQLLDAGIDVYTTLNVQHLESLNDVVAKLTGVVVRETVPDAIFENADEVEFVDLAPDDLIERMREGKVYVRDQASRALEHFFNKGNLIALRELALRRMAERVERQMSAYRSELASARSWSAVERLVVCVGPGPSSANLVRAARRMAAGLRSSWIAVHVETPADRGFSADDARRLAHTMRLAEQLGGETVTLSGTSVAEEIVLYAQSRGATKIIIGKPRSPRWKEWLRGSFVYDVTRRSQDIDVLVISGEAGPAQSSLATTPAPIRNRDYVEAVAAVAMATCVAWGLSSWTDAVNLVMVYLVAVVAVSLRAGGGPSAVTSVLGVLAFDFFFIRPYYTFAVNDSQYLFTCLVMLVTGLVVSQLTSRLKGQAAAARARERRTTTLYAMVRDLLQANGVAGVATCAANHLRGVADGDVFVVVSRPSEAPREGPALETLAGEGRSLDERELVVAHWTIDHGQSAGVGTETLPATGVLFLPMTTPQRTVGAIGLRPADTSRPPSHEQVHFLEAVAAQVALAIERIMSLEELDRGRLAVEAERMRSALLSAVSHDLRTPLAAIVGSASALVDGGARLDETARGELAASIQSQAERLSRLVANLLDMTRLEAGAMEVRREWHSAAEIVGGALADWSRRLAGRQVTTRIDPHMPLVAVDALLMHQVVVNLVDNAARHAGEGSTIDIAAWVEGGQFHLDVADRGPGVAHDMRERIFEKFQRANHEHHPTGAGLGLAIARGIVELHSGRIWVEDRAGGGAVFRLTIPQAEPAPKVPEAAD